MVQIFIKLALLKPEDELTSEFVRLENKKIVESLWLFLRKSEENTCS